MAWVSSVSAAQPSPSRSTPVDVNNREMMLKIIKSAINTKAINRWSELACSIALDAVRTVELEENGRKEIDIKKYAKVEKVRPEPLRCMGCCAAWGAALRGVLRCVGCCAAGVLRCWGAAHGGLLLSFWH